MVWILLFIVLTSTVTGKTSPTIYQPEENDNVTIQWETQMKLDTSVTNLHCVLHSEPLQVLYEMINGVEVPESRDQQFVGRVQLDRDALREGRLTIHLSNVTEQDSGNYWCELAADYDTTKTRRQLKASTHFVLNVIQIFHEDNRDVSTAAPGPGQLEGPYLGETWSALLAFISLVGVFVLLIFLVFHVLPENQLIIHTHIMF